LKPEDDKSRYMPDANAIFIDDSFSERKKVAQSRQIPVFDVHMLDALL
jgi:carbamoyl-phosphate synthase large subunit